MSLLCLAYFTLGLIRDAVGAWYYIQISSRRALSASFWSGVITMFDIVILATILIRWDIWLALAYSLGCGCGCYFVVRRNR